MGTLSLLALQSWDPATLNAAGDQVAATSATLDQGLRTVSTAVSTVQDSWSGQGADAAVAQAGRITTAGNRASTALVTLADVLSSASADLASLRSYALDVVGSARSDGFLVFDDGRVQAPTAPAGASEQAVAQHQGELDAAARAYAEDIDRAIAAVARADSDWASKITAAVAELSDIAASPVTEAATVSAAAQAILAGRAVLPSDPKDLHTLWDTLTAQDKEALFAAEPGIGNRPGIPTVDRDHFDQRHLLTLQAEEARTNATLRAALGGAPPMVAYPTADMVRSERDYQLRLAAVTASDERLRGYAAVTASMGAGPTGRPPMYLMGIDGADRANIATGNPDTAKNVATMVTGLYTKTSGIGDDVTRAGRVREAAKKAGAPETAVVTWYGHHAPQTPLQATDENYAEAGAGDLDTFQDGLRATHLGAPSLNTVLGHSYGTTTVGAAASGSHSLNADNVVFVASPGTTTSTVTDLHLDGSDPAQNGQHVFATKAAADFVPLYGDVVGTLGLGMGPDPTAPFYGAHSFTSADGGEGPGNMFRNLDAHSGYWDPNSPSLKSMGMIVAGAGSAAQ